MVKVEVRDGLDVHGNEEESETEADDFITVRILVRDMPEAPEAPTVTVTSPLRCDGSDRGDANGDLGQAREHGARPHRLRG